MGFNVGGIGGGGGGGAAGIPYSEKGAANGVATLDALGKVPIIQLPDTVVGALDYQGTWDASTGSYPVGPSKGDYWVINVAGTMGGTLYNVGDWAIYNGAAWEKLSAGHTEQSGVAAFTNEASKAVVFSVAFLDASYSIRLTPSVNTTTWYTNKVAAGFTIQTGGNITGEVSWQATK